MKAMDMVSAAKLHKARARLDGARPIFEELKSIIDDLKLCEEVRDNFYVAPREAKSTAYVIFTSDKGLCGSYNRSVSEAALAHMEGKNEQILVVGAKGVEFFKRREKNIIRRITDISEAQIYEGTGRMAERVHHMYLSGEADEVYVAYAKFETTLKYAPRVERILPLSGGDKTGTGYSGMKYEPDPNTFLNELVPLYLHMYFFATHSESLACEHAARMLSMESADKNATDIIEELTLMYNRRRQAAITQEINEIVSGANILR
jgi:F-type H+-transporting ATPase subunit gamma